MSAPRSVSVRPSRNVVASASPAPLILGAAAVLASLVLAVVVAVNVSIPLRFFGLSIPIVLADHMWLSLIGYLLTPIGAVVAAGWDRIAQREAGSRSGNFVPNRAFGSALTVIAAGGLLLGVWHIVNVSVPLSEFWGVGR